MISHRVLKQSALGQEADVLVTDGTYEFLYFVHPWKPSWKAHEGPYFLLFADQIYRTTQEQLIKRLSGLEHHLTGIVESLQPPTMRIGAFVFSCDAPFPATWQWVSQLRFIVIALTDRSTQLSCALKQT